MWCAPNPRACNFLNASLARVSMALIDVLRVGSYDLVPVICCDSAKSAVPCQRCFATRVLVLKQCSALCIDSGGSVGQDTGTGVGSGMPNAVTRSSRQQTAQLQAWAEDWCQPPHAHASTLINCKQYLRSTCPTMIMEGRHSLNHASAPVVVTTEAPPADDQSCSSVRDWKEMVCNRGGEYPYVNDYPEWLAARLYSRLANEVLRAGTRLPGPAAKKTCGGHRSP